MAVLHGNSGNVAWTGDASADSKILAWTLDGTAEIIDITSMDDSVANGGDGYRVRIGGHVDWQATVDTINDGPVPTTFVNLAEVSLVLGQVGTAQDMTLLRALATSVTETVSATGVAQLTWTFVLSGSIV